MKSQKVITIVLLSLVAGLAAAKDKDKNQDYAAVLTWPQTGPATLKFRFDKFRALSSYGGQHEFIEDVTAENVSPKNIPFASFTVYLLDKDKVRIADSILQLKDLGPSQQVKQSLRFNTSGIPASVSLVARNDVSGVPASLKAIPVKIISVPSGAKLKVDGQDVGLTPYTARLIVGSHSLEFSKEGYATGSTPLEVAPDDAPGGSITFELAGLSKDTVELRDGTVLLCEVLSMSISQITVRVAGQEQTYDRNRVKKIILVEREITQTPIVIQPPTKQ